MFSMGDFFMGSVTHPRLFGDRVDIKVVAETRVSWTLLLLLTTSAWMECADKNDGQYVTVFIFFYFYFYSCVFVSEKSSSFCIWMECSLASAKRFSFSSPCQCFGLASNERE